MGNKQTPGTIVSNSAQLVRTVTVADAAPFNDANCDPTIALITTNWKRVRFFCRFTGGTSPTATLLPLHRMTSVSGNGWVPDATTTPLTDGEYVDLEVGGRDVFFAVSAIVGAPTSVAIYCAGWEPVRRVSGMSL